LDTRAHTQVLLLVIGLLACGAAAWGMVSLRHDILPSLNARIDSMQELPARIVSQVSGLAHEAAQLALPLSNISAVIRSADVDGVRADLQRVAAFLQDAPSPGQLHATLQALSLALKPRLYEGLRALHGQISLEAPSSQLAALKAHVDTLAAFDASAIAPATTALSDAMLALYRRLRSDW
jgi:hypothetical protein